MSAASLLPPNASSAERSLEASTARVADVPVPIRDLWNPDTCPTHLLPWLAWGLSIDIWDSSWSETQKRTAIADAIPMQRRKGTRASLRTVLDRFDPAIGLAEWFEDPVNLAPYGFRLELPLNADTTVTYDEALVSALLRDIATVKPLRSHMTAVHKLDAQVNAFLVSGGNVAGFNRLVMEADLASATDESWQWLVQSDDGEPLELDDGTLIEESL